MGQENVYQFLKKNVGKKFSTEEIAKGVEGKKRSVYKSLAQLERDNEIRAEMSRVGQSRHPTKLYMFVPQSDVGLLFDELMILRQKHELIGADVLSTLMVASEIRKLRGDLRAKTNE